MINEYNKPAAWKYVETPYAEMLKHGMVQQANYDEAVASIADYDAKLGALKRIDEDTYQKVVSKYDQDFRNMYDQYGGDWGAMKNKVKQRLSAETANPYYNLNRAHVEEYEKEQALKKQIKANNGSTLTFDEVPLSLIGKNGRLISVKDITSNIERMHDYNEAITRDWKNVLNPESHGYETGLDQLKEGNLAKLKNKAYLQFVKTVTSGISSGQINKKEAAVLGSYLNSEVGMQHVRALTKSKELGGGGRSEEEAIRIIADQVSKTGHSMEYTNYDIDTKVQTNALWNGGGGGSGNKKVDSFSNLPTHIGNEVNTVKPNQSENELNVANIYSEARTKQIEKLNDIDRKLALRLMQFNDYSPSGPRAKGTLALVQKDIENYRKQKEYYTKQIEKTNQAITYHRTEALKTNTRITDFAKFMGININVNDPKSVNAFWNNPVAANAYNNYIKQRSHYLNTEVLINNKDFVSSMTDLLLSDTESAIEDKDGKLIDFDIKPNTEPIIEYVNGSNRLKIKYKKEDGNGSQIGYISKSKLPIAIANRMDEMNAISESMNSSKDGIKFKLGPDQYMSITGTKYAQATGSNIDPEGKPLNPMGTYFVDGKGQYWTANSLRGVGFNDIEFTGSTGHKYGRNDISKQGGSYNFDSEEDADDIIENTNYY